MPRSEKMENLTEWAELTKLVMEDRRRSKRVPLVFPIEVSGFDCSGRHFSKTAKTCDISEAGCRFQIKAQIEPGEVVAIQLIARSNDQAPAGKAVLFQIVWVSRHPDCWEVGALKLQPESIWHMSFPPRDQPKASSE
jgi:hypothetical protein